MKSSKPKAQSPASVKSEEPKAKSWKPLSFDTSKKGHSRTMKIAAVDTAEQPKKEDDVSSQAVSEPVAQTAGKTDSSDNTPSQQQDKPDEDSSQPALLDKPSDLKVTTDETEVRTAAEVNSQRAAGQGAAESSDAQENPEDQIERTE